MRAKLRSATWLWWLAVLLSLAWPWVADRAAVIVFRMTTPTTLALDVEPGTGVRWEYRAVNVCDRAIRPRIAGESCRCNTVTVEPTVVEPGAPFRVTVVSNAPTRGLHDGWVVVVARPEGAALGRAAMLRFSARARSVNGLDVAPALANVTPDSSGRLPRVRFDVRIAQRPDQPAPSGRAADALRFEPAGPVVVGSGSWRLTSTGAEVSEYGAEIEVDFGSLASGGAEEPRVWKIHHPVAGTARVAVAVVR